MDAPTRTFGPVQLLSVAFQGNRFKGEILPILEELKRSSIVQLIDLIVVRKDSMGAVATLTATDLDWEEAEAYGKYIGALIGFGAFGAEGVEESSKAAADHLSDGHLFTAHEGSELAQTLPNGMSAALALIEHVWALPLVAAIDRAGGFEVSNEWITTDALVQIGLRHAAVDGA